MKYRVVITLEDSLNGDHVILTQHQSAEYCLTPDIVANAKAYLDIAYEEIKYGFSRKKKQVGS